jgi:hypothetical protein
MDPVFIIKSWGEEDAAIRIDGRSVAWGGNARRGHENTLEGTDLVVWMKLEADTPVRVQLSRSSR